MSTPILDPDDPRLTAYALGESVSAAERQAVEKLLATSPAARTAVEQIRALAILLEQDFAHENAVYQQAHPPMAIPANVIPFPRPARRWRNVVMLGGAVAAVLVALGTLVLPALRRTTPLSVASVQPAAPPAAKEALPPPTVSLGTPTDTPPLLAEATQPEARGGADEAADKSFDPDADRVTEKEVQTDQRARMRPGAAQAAPQAAAAPMPLSASPPAGLSAAALVRVRFPDGTFVGGVLLNADGRVLMAREFPVDEKSGAVVVILADGRQFPADALQTGSRFATRLVQLKAAGLPHVSLATERPASGSSLEIARFDDHDGTASLIRTHNGATGELIASGAVFVFDAAGKLLASEPAPVAAKAAATLSRAKVRRDEAAPVALRPFTAAERAALLGPEK